MEVRIVAWKSNRGKKERDRDCLHLFAYALVRLQEVPADQGTPEGQKSPRQRRFALIVIGFVGIAAYRFRLFFGIPETDG